VCGVFWTVSMEDVKQAATVGDVLEARCVTNFQFVLDKILDKIISHLGTGHTHSLL